MKILALDLAGITGVAVGSSGGDPRSWSVDIGKSQSQDQRFANVIRLTRELIQTHQPNKVVLEAAIGGKQASAYLSGLVACVRGAVRLERRPCEVIHLGPVRKHFLGRAVTVNDFPLLDYDASKAAIKQLVIDRCETFGWKVEDDNAADACALWDYAMSQSVDGYQSKPLGGLFDAARQ